MSSYLTSQRYNHSPALPNSRTLQVLSVGHREALASGLWLRALVYVGDEFVHRSNADDVYRYADAIIDVDPAFRRAYSWAATLSLYRPRATMSDGLRAVAYIERGILQFPNDPELLWELGAIYSFELPSLTADVEDKAKYRDLGSEHLRLASTLGAGPPWLALTTATHLMEVGRTELAIDHLEQMYAIVRDDDVRREIAQRLESLRATSTLEQFRIAELEIEEQRQRYPWLPAEFVILMGNR